MSEKQLPFITLPYKGQQGAKVPKSFKTSLHRFLPNNIETKVVYNGTKLDSNFQIKDKTKFDNKHDLDYVKCLDVKTTLEKQVGDFMNEFVTIVGRITNPTS